VAPGRAERGSACRWPPSSRYSRWVGATEECLLEQGGTTPSEPPRDKQRPGEDEFSLTTRAT
jgi:hypothetical protein